MLSGFNLNVLTMLLKARTPEKRSITPEKAKKILLENGVEINEKEAEEILEIMYFIAKLIVDQNFRNDEKIR
jgi:hypothetical protein